MRRVEDGSFEKRDKGSATTSRCNILYTKITTTEERKKVTHTYMRQIVFIMIDIDFFLTEWIYKSTTKLFFLEK